MTRFRELASIGVIGFCLIGAGCGKKTAVNTPAPVTPQTPVAQTSTPTPTERKVTALPTAEEKAAPRYPDAATIAKIEDLIRRIQDAYFDYNKHVLRPDAEKTLADNAQALAAILKQYPDYRLTVEGHCDERGSDEYNLALGDARARTAKEYLGSLGIPGDQLNILSYGKQQPQCSEHDEACWQKNRRAHIVAMTR